MKVPKEAARRPPGSMYTGRSYPPLSRNSLISLGSALSTQIASKAKRSFPIRTDNLAKAGSSTRQGGHQVAQKWTKTFLPLRSPRDNASPESRRTVNSGTRSPTRRGRPVSQPQGLNATRTQKRTILPNQARGSKSGPLPWQTLWGKPVFPKVGLKAEPRQFPGRRL